MICSRCREREAEVKTRGEQFCAGCYREFVGRKFRTAMSVFRVNGSPDQKIVPPLLVAAVSFGVSSLVLVELLREMLEAQRAKHNGMTGFRLLCIYLGDGELPFAWPWADTQFMRIPQTPLFAAMLPELDSGTKLSRSSRQDLEAILTRQACLAVAAEHGAAATVFGHSMTRISELTLAETVKGRGAGIPALVSPDLVEDRICYPLRDITQPELKKYAHVSGLLEYVLPEPAVPGITKMQSIDEIVHAYFADIQVGFPSVVSTVSKVASKLSQDAEPCQLCRGDEGAVLCYACQAALGERSLASPRADLHDILQEYSL